MHDWLAAPARVLAATLLIIPLIASPASASPSSTAVEAQLIHLVNADRARAGLAPLRVDVRLVAGARAWSQQMAAEGATRHDPNLTAHGPAGASSWAENVGRATGDDIPGRIHRAFMESPAHRANIMSRDLTDFGVGIAISGGAFWVTERFTAGAAASVAAAVEATASLARSLFGGNAEHAVIVRDDAFPDALAAAPLAGGRGPILLTPPGPAVHPEVRQTLEQTLPAGRRIWIVGGPTAVPEEVAAELRSGGWDVVRISGEDRIQTAASVAHAVTGGRSADTVLVATAADWPDAASGGAYGAKAGAPVLLTDPHRLSPVTAQTLRDLRPRRVIALGGVAALSDGVVREAGATRVAGASRQDTAAAVADELWGWSSDNKAPSWTAVPGWGDDAWTWAFTAAPLGARLDSPVLPVSAPLTDGLRSYLQQCSYSRQQPAAVHVHGPVAGEAIQELSTLTGS